MLRTGATGVARYAAGLAAAQHRLSSESRILYDDAASSDPLGRWAVALSGRTRYCTAAGIADRRSVLRARHVFRAAHVHFGLYGRLLEVRIPGPPGLFHWTYPVPIRAAGWSNLYTVHDVIPLDHPDLSPVGADRLRRVLARIMASADGIITVSEHARSRIVAQTGCDPDFVTNCYQSVPRAGQHGAGMELPAGLQNGGYHLVCGSIEPRKNIARIIAAHSASGTRRPLVLAGPRGWRSAEAMGGAVDGVVELGYQSDAVLEALVRSAHTLLMPSLAEGFGLPVVEAMAVGVPVLTSAGGALAEIAGDGALLVDPRNVDAIAAGLRLLDGDEDFRARISASGLRRARRYEPAVFARRLHAVYAQHRPIMKTLSRASCPGFDPVSENLIHDPTAHRN